MTIGPIRVNFRICVEFMEKRLAEKIQARVALAISSPGESWYENRAKREKWTKRPEGEIKSWSTVYAPVTS